MSSIGETPGAQVAGREVPDSFDKLPAFLTSLAAAGLQDRRCSDSEAVDFPRRLLDLAERFGRFPESGNMQDVPAEGLLSWLPPVRPDAQTVDKFRRDLLDGVLPGARGDDLSSPPMDIPVPAALSSGHQARNAPRTQPSWPLWPRDEWQPVALDSSWPLVAQVLVPDFQAPLLRDGFLTPAIHQVMVRLERCALVMESRAEIYAACKVLIATPDGKYAPSPTTRRVASKARGLAGDQVLTWSRAAVLLATAFHDGLVRGGAVLVAQMKTTTRPTITSRT